jgi:hypothetical protein
MGEPVEFAPLVDMSTENLRDLFVDDDSNLAACVNRLLRDLDDPDGVISAFQSFASGGDR